MKKYIFIISSLLVLLLGFIACYFINKPKISVVMPVYNTEKYLPQSIESILEQSFKDFELIIVNDCSTDKSLEVIQNYAAQDKRIRVFSLPQNSGVSAARNEGLRHIRGKYTIVVDSDDWLTPNMLYKLYAHAEKEKLDIVLSDAIIFDDIKQKYTGWPRDWPTFLDSRLLRHKGLTVFSYKDLPDDFFQFSSRFTWNKLIKSSLIQKYDLKFQIVKKHTDSTFIAQAMLRAQRIGYIPRGLYVYRTNRSTAITSQVPSDLSSVYAVFKELKTNLEDMGIYPLLQNSFDKWISRTLPWRIETDEDKMFVEKIKKLQATKAPNKISIIMPVYNTEKYISQSIESILNQDFQDFELIIVNDESTDTSMDIVNKYAQNDERIKIFSMPQNSGVANARNEGLRHANGKYTMFVDSDDWLNPEALQNLYIQAERYGLDVLLFNAQFYDNEKQKLLEKHWWKDFVDFDYLQKNKLSVFKIEDIASVFFKFSPRYAWIQFIKTSLIKENNIVFKQVTHFDDAYFTTMTLLKAQRIGTINKILYNYRINRTTSVTAQHDRYTIEYMQGLYNAINYIMEGIRQNDPQLYTSKVFRRSLEHWVKELTEKPQKMSAEQKYYLNKILDLTANYQ